MPLLYCILYADRWPCEFYLFCSSHVGHIRRYRLILTLLFLLFLHLLIRITSTSTKRQQQHMASYLKLSTQKWDTFEISYGFRWWRDTLENILEIFLYRLTLTFIYPLKHKKYLHVKRWGEIYCDVIRGVSFPSKSMCFFKSALFLGRELKRTCHL